LTRPQRNPRRSYGTGSLFTHRGKWYGQWLVGGRLIKRAIGPKREPGSRHGLTKRQAEAELRRRIQEVRSAPPGEHLTLEEAGERYIRHVEVVLERKPTTVSDYRSMLRCHLAPHFGQKGIDKITTEDISAYMAAKASEGLQTKTISNHLNFAHGLFGFAVDKKWATANPVASVSRPRVSGADPDIRYLDRDQIEALLRAVPDDRLGPTDRVLYLTATMAGLRQGELIALRWQDVDWTAGVIRVRRSFTRGQFGTPKSKRSTRAVPMADRLGGELERHFQGSDYQADEDLVFAHPDTGGPYDASKMRKRFKAGLKAAGVRPVRLHDLRHSYGTAMAAAGAPLRALQEWMGHKDYKTTEIYADYAPDPSQGARWAEAAFGAGIETGIDLSTSESNSDQDAVPEDA
jgi:integrase